MLDFEELEKTPLSKLIDTGNSQPSPARGLDAGIAVRGLDSSGVPATPCTGIKVPRARGSRFSRCSDQIGMSGSSGLLVFWA
jgi:hypothetical protein